MWHNEPVSQSYMPGLGSKAAKDLEQSKGQSVNSVEAEGSPANALNAGKAKSMTLKTKEEEQDDSDSEDDSDVTYFVPRHKD